ncbi:NDP-glycosyltransferase YjiC-like [Oppia nitens]|uniref:NDP-glycosyltransferase YjiC-like n=1 Tax=Oppia nitens TaxID=1686743 RepID=UPI0023DB272B|nr:NDP-glycosyltransferase YjiC-like [Oppia nitens]
MKKLKVLFMPIDGTGHVNASIALAQVLIKAGHECTFGICDQWRGKLEPYRIREILWSMNDRQNADESAAKYWGLYLKEKGILGPVSPLEKAVIILKEQKSVNKTQQEIDDKVEQTISQVRPDIIILDQMSSLIVKKSGIPWVLVCSCNPLTSIRDDRTPPAFSGLPTTGPISEWQTFNRVYNENIQETWQVFNDIEVANGFPKLKENSLISESKYLNIYGYPLELDYLDIRPLPDNWYRFDNFMRSEQHLPFEIPEQLLDKPGKLIYFSLGSMGGTDVDNMKRLVGILAKSKHRFIVSKGPLDDEYDLPDNMWGEISVPQINVLPLVDLVITHGGNNTITETFSCGKPMIVMPLFGDQYDNAQRVHEKGFGIRLDAYKCSEEELLTTIESLVNDNILSEKLKKISQRIRTENSLTKLPEIFENLVQTYAIAQVLIKAGHECTFGICDQWRGKLEPYGIREILWSMNDRENADQSTAKYWGLYLKEKGILGPEGPLEKAVIMLKDQKNIVEMHRKINQKVEQTICQLKPDIILVDQMASLVSVMKSGVVGT